MTALVLDASAVVDLLLHRVPPSFDAALAGAPLVTCAHLDAEVLSALARLHRGGHLSAHRVGTSLADLSALPVERLPLTGALLSRAWALRRNVATRDALYVAAAEALGGLVLTTDERLRRAVPDAVVDLE